MNKTYKQVNQYFALNSFKSSITSVFLDKKRKVPFNFSSKDLAEENYRWDPAVQRFIKIER